MKRKIFELRIPKNYPANFYQLENEWINVSDIDRPLPANRYLGWDPNHQFWASWENKDPSNPFPAKEIETIYIPHWRIKEKDLKAFIKEHILTVCELKFYDGRPGNIFLMIKESTIKNELLIGMFVSPGFGGTFIDEIGQDD